MLGGDRYQDTYTQTMYAVYIYKHGKKEGIWFRRRRSDVIDGVKAGLCLDGTPKRLVFGKCFSSFVQVLSVKALFWCLLASAVGMVLQ